MNLILLSVLIGLTVLVAASGIARLMRGEGRVAERLREIRGNSLLGSETLEKALGAGSLPFWLQPLRLLSLVLPGASDSPLLRWELASAGYRHVEAPRVFTGVRVLTTVSFGLVAWASAPLFNLRSSETILVTGVAGLLGFVFPLMLLKVRQHRRRQDITLALPDALDLMVICVEAGQGLNAALLSVSRESSMHAPALSDELRILNLEMSTGLPRAKALRNLAQRTGIDDMRALVAVLVQSDKFGTSIAQALRTHAQSLRIRRRQRAEEQARKTPVKMVFPLVFCIFPAIWVVTIGPAAIRFMTVLFPMIDNMKH
jgi:tight adherence protein C